MATADIHDPHARVAVETMVKTGMAIIAGWWGVWHIIAGLSLAFFWSRRPAAIANGEAAA